MKRKRTNLVELGTLSRAGMLIVLSGLAGTGCDAPLAPVQSTMVLREGQIVVPVVGQPVSVAVTRDLVGTQSVAGRAVRGSVVVDVENAAGATGRVDLRVTGASVNVTAAIDAVDGTQLRIPLSTAQAEALAAHAVTFRASGTLCPAAGCVTVPLIGQTVTLNTRIELVMETGP